MPIIKTLGIVVSNKKILILKIYFSPCDLDMQWTKLFEQKEGHIRIIPAKFG